MQDYKIILIVKDGKIADSSIEPLPPEITISYVDKEVAWPIHSDYPPPYTLDSYNIQNCIGDPALEHFFEEERKENEAEQR